MDMETDILQQQAKALQDEVIAWRRYLHSKPELSFHEYETAAFVYETLQSFGNLILSRPTKTSVMARLVGAQPGSVLAVRADMDALPITEENDVAFVSKNKGVMHACGHDGHTAMLLGTAKVMSKFQAQLKGEIRFLFQHAEESPPGGAEEMVQAGVLDGVDHIIGAHLWSPLEVGKVGIINGPAMAGGDIFTITINGKGGHAGVPHELVDSIAVGSQAVTNLQHIVSRNTDPLESVVLSITKFIGGSASNVIPESVEITGTVRYFENSQRERVPALMERIVKGITDAHGASYDFQYLYGYRPVINDEMLTKLAEETVRDLYGEGAIAHLQPVMAGEDFSSYLQQTPGCFLLIGAGNKEKGIIYPHHHPRFAIDEDALDIGVRIFVQFIYKTMVLANGE